LLGRGSGSRAINRSLSWIDHAAGGLIRLLNSAGGQGLVGLGLLIRLDKRAENAAARESDVSDTVAFEVVLGAGVGALHRHRHPMETAETRGAEEEATGVDRLVALKAAILPESVVRLAKGNAREAVGQQAEVDGVEAVEEASCPCLGIRGRLRVDGLARLVQNRIHAVLPVLDILVIDRAVGVLGRHYVLVRAR